ncbi:putative potassium transporter protein [Botrytis fragariae]|uniref:Potassium transport protein n=1 Tax=Botrytis fragariae TaxID=1964551 RepID=A0A8H6ANF3_9HELO|nr:putative potassium transporter protein [Botrytis fragariae]KAF5870968.1 putative potassium transporter protein [Botrytis fragariae]
MFTLLLELWQHIAALKPSFISKSPHFNFITVHYFWIIGMTLLGSICLYIRGGIPYIDALFFASGCATQSGLNTININTLNTWQQIVLYLIPIFTNPITINSFVVFLRLYWFEKRFQHIAAQNKRNRRSIAKSFSRSRTTGADTVDAEKGVNGRNIVVMHGTTRANVMRDNRDAIDDIQAAIEKEKALNKADAVNGSGSSNISSTETANDPSPTSHHTQIKFADQVKRSNGLADEELRLPVRRRDEDHIAFLERQRNPEDRTILRIPGPRDADAGVAPQTVEEEEEDPVVRTLSRRGSMYSRRGSHDRGTLNGESQWQDHYPSRKRNVTIEVPTHPKVERAVDDVKAAGATMKGVMRFRNNRNAEGIEATETQGNGNGAVMSRLKSRAPTFQSIKTALTGEKEDPTPYLSWAPTIGRNSAFVDLTEQQREELGGIEYRSLKSLALILSCYFLGFSIFAVVCLLPWILNSRTYGSIVEQDGQGRVWWSIFTASSAFTDLGFTLTPDSMISFNTAIWPLLLMSFLIIIGNTGFPIMLRFIIWVTTLWVPRNSAVWEELRFLLDHPRRCFTLLFPSKATWWLFWILVILNGVDLLFFIILDLGNSVVTDLPVNIRVLDGWFQAASTRTAGFGVVNLAELHPAIQVSYLIMMYISVLPIAISVRRTNVYEEKSLGIYGSPTEENEDEGEPSYVGAHLRRQLSFDLWYIFLGLFIISIAEGSRLQGTDPSINMFSVLFEIVSAYGTVGLSLGYPGIDASLSAEFNVVSKLVIIAMQIRGRHRGLPYELDRAILLPSEHLAEKEALDAAQRVHRRNSNATAVSNGTDLATVNTGVQRVNTERQAPSTNFLSSLLHPGPTIPNSHRNQGTTHVRRHSIATPERGRSVSPKASGGIFSKWNSSDKHQNNVDKKISE